MGPYGPHRLPEEARVESCGGSEGIPAQEACKCNSACVFDHTVGKGKPWVHGGKKVGSDRTDWRFSFLKKKSLKIIFGLHFYSGYVFLAAVSRGYSLGAVHGLLTAAASLAVEHRLSGVQAL